MADQFVLVRIVNMRGVDLTIFDFDYDLTWAAFFMNSGGHVYGRYGGRDEGPADQGLSIVGLSYAMGRALDAFRRHPDAKPQRVAKRQQRVEQFPAARRVKQGACIHCHQVYNFRHELLLDSNRWKKDDIWVYPPPKSVGIELQRQQGDRIKSVAPGSAAARTGLRPGDTLTSFSGLPVASYADVQYALHRSPQSGSVPVVWTRNGRRMTDRLVLQQGWRESDFSWRGSMWTMPPVPGVYGRDLTPTEKRKLGLSAKRLAFRQGKYVPNKSRKAGIRGGDIILGIDRKQLEMTMLQFNAWVRKNYEVGDRIRFNVIRDEKRIEIPMLLPKRGR